MKISLLMACVALPWICSPVLGDDRPNIIIILSDDMGFSDLGCYGGEINTPHLDRLAKNGLRFTQFYNTARCCPTRAALLTGLYPHQAGVGHMTDDHGLPGYRGDLNRRCVTIAEALRPAGYRTYMAGKWHVTRHTQPDGDKHNWPLQRGFDRYYGTIIGGGSFFDPAGLARDNTMISALADPEYKPAQFYYTQALSDHAKKFVSEHRRDHGDKPFFLYLAYTAAHWPMHALPVDIEKQRGKYDGGYDAIRQARLENARQLGLIDPSWKLAPTHGSWASIPDKAWETRCMEVFAAMVESMDRGIGELTQELERNDQLDNTLILYLQDNGGCAEGVGRSPDVIRGEKPSHPPIPLEKVFTEWRAKQTRDGWPVLTGSKVMPGPHDTFIAYGKEWANVSNTPFREYKHWVHEGGISTPLIAHWPKRITARGELRHQPSHLIDLMPTCLEISKATYPKESGAMPLTPLEGRSLVPAFKNESIARDGIFWEHEGNRAMRAGDWKLVAKGTTGAWELYDMKSDRTEMQNLAAQHPDRVQSMVAAWEAWAHRANVLPWIWKPKYGKSGTENPADHEDHATRFELEMGDDLPAARSPKAQNASLSICVNLSETAPDGVLVAQGGGTHGYSLYLSSGKVAFAVRRSNRLWTVTASKSLPKAPVKIVVTVSSDGSVQIMANQKAIASGKVDGPLIAHPAEGLQVGRDAGAAVGDYEAPFSFEGKIERVVIEIGK